MLRKIWEKYVNYETVSHLIYGALITAADSVVYTVLEDVDVGVGVSQALSWLAVVLFVYVVNKLTVSRNYNMRPSHLAREVGTSVAARVFSGVVIWVLMVVAVRLGGDRGFIYKLSCKLTSSVINMVLNYVFSKPRTSKKE